MMNRHTVRALCLIFLALIIIRAFYYTPDEPQEPSTTVFEGNAMTMNYRVVIGAPLSTAERQKAKKTIDAVFHEVHTLYNKWNPDSELSMLNRLKSGEQKRVSPQLNHLLHLTNQVVEITEGRFDPTIEPMQRLWKQALEIGQEPKEEEWAHILPAIGWQHIHLQDALFSKDHDLTEIDLGGIAKGYAVDLLAEQLHRVGFSHFLVEWGGEVRAIGQHPEGRAWHVLILPLNQTPFHTPLGQIELHDNAVATSGDYFQNWTVPKNGKSTTYFHIIDPRNYRPLMVEEHSIASATVVAPSCAIADGLATAAMLCSNPTEAQAWIDKIQATDPNIRIYLFTR